MGFFGPVTWVRCAEDGPALEVRPGGRPLSDRRVFFEDWAVRAYAAKLAEDPAVRRWLPPALQPQLTLDGRRVLRRRSRPSRCRPPRRCCCRDATAGAGPSTWPPR
nr:hypothetical protein GCM10020093_102250 [Planobispora longispora]